MKLYINRKILWGLIASISITIVLGILSYRYFLSLTAATRWSNHARRIVQSVEDMQSMLIQVENAQRGYLITAKENYIKQVELNTRALDSLVLELKDQTRDNPVQQSNLDALRPLVLHQIDYTNRVLESRKVSLDKAAELINTSESADNMAKLQSKLTEIRQEEQSLILSRSLTVQTGFYRFVWAFLGLILVIIGVLLGLVWLINSNSRSRSIAEQKLRDAELETKKINQDLESFSYSVSHDLRAPLRSINGYSQILIEDYAEKLDEEGSRIINVIINNAKKMSQLIDDLLEFSRLGRQELHRSAVDVHEQVQLITAELLEREPNRKIEMNIQPLGTAMIDPNMMRQVWINLIGNAIKYSRNTELSIIGIGRTDQKDKAIFYVKDNGAGFDMAYKDKLFGVFQRLHKSHEFEGTGVGLALVKRIIDRHKGQIWAEGKVGEGATFYFSLPIV